MSVHMKEQITNKKGLKIYKDGIEVNLGKNIMKAIELIINESEKEWYSPDELLGKDWDSPKQMIISNLVGGRCQAGLTQEQLAKKLGIHQSNLSAMENGDRKVPKKYHKKLEKILNAEPGDFDEEFLREKEQRLKQENQD